MNRSVWPLWFLTKSKKADSKRGFRDRRKQTLFIDARKLGTLIDRVHRELTDVDLEKITSTYHAWRGVASTKNKKPGTKTPTIGIQSRRDDRSVVSFRPVGATNRAVALFSWAHDRPCRPWARALIFNHISEHARLEIPMDLRDLPAFSPPRPASGRGGRGVRGRALTW